MDGWLLDLMRRYGWTPADVSRMRVADLILLRDS